MGPMKLAYSGSIEIGGAKHLPHEKVAASQMPLVKLPSLLPIRT